MDIEGRVAIVTGASSGIGRASAFALATAGAAVVMGDVDAAGGAETLSMIEAAGGRGVFVKADLSTKQGVLGLFEQAETSYGGIDIVHNNAGIVSGEPLWPDMDDDLVLRMILVNFAAVALGTQAAIRAMAPRGGGVVVNTASIVALVGMSQDPIYAATKAAVVTLTKSCAHLNESHKVRVNALLPGGVRTPILNKTGDGTRPAAWMQEAVDSPAMLEPEDIAAEVLVMVRDDSLVGEAKIVSAVPLESFPGAGS